MPAKKGNGKAGGGLIARLKFWELETPNGYARNGNGVQNVRHHKPGSQNPRKGGPGHGYVETVRKSQRLRKG